MPYGRKKLLWLGVLPLLGWVGCAPVGPNYRPPEMNLPASFSRGGMQWKRHDSTVPAKPRAWWRMFGDSELNQYVDQSLSANQTLAAASARLQEARALSQVARSYYFPDIDLGVGVSRSKTRIRMPGGGTNLSNDFSVPLDLRYEVDVWGKVARQVESAQAQEAAAAESLNAMRLTVAGEVAQTYWALRAVDADRIVVAKALDIRRKGLELIEKKKAAGEISGLDLARGQTEVATAESDRLLLEQQRVNLVNALAVLTGRSATGMSVTNSPKLPSPPDVPVSVPSEVLRQRPDIRAAERRVAAANAEIGVATAAFYPSFTINGSSGFDSNLFPDLFNASSLVWSIGSEILQPIARRQRLTGQLRAKEAAHAAASADYRQAALEAMREVEDALQGMAILQRRETIQDQAVAAAQKTLDLSVDRFKSGMVSLLDVVDAERTLRESERLANAIRAERLTLAVSLAKAVGGEW